MHRVLWLAVVLLPGCASNGDRWQREDASSKTLDFGETCVVDFTTETPRDVRLGYTVRDGSANVYVMTWDNCVSAKNDGGAYSRKPTVHERHKTFGGEFTVHLGAGRWAVVFANAAGLVLPGNDQSIILRWDICSTSPAGWGKGSRSVEFHPDGECPSCLRKNCYRVHAICTKCDGKGTIWSETLKAETTCESCHGTGRSDE